MLFTKWENPYSNNVDRVNAQILGHEVEIQTVFADSGYNSFDVCISSKELLTIGKREGKINGRFCPVTLQSKNNVLIYDQFTGKQEGKIKTEVLKVLKAYVQSEWYRLHVHQNIQDQKEKFLAQKEKALKDFEAKMNEIKTKESDFLERYN